MMIANRGEIALRIARAAHALNLATVGIYAVDDAASPHLDGIGRALPLSGVGPAAYLNLDEIVRLAREAGATLLHPGYGFLSENEAFATACHAADITFVGPEPQTLATFGDKSAARRLVESCNVPLIPGVEGPATLPELEQFMQASRPDAAGIMLKALAGGGGRGMRVVTAQGDLPTAFALCQSEAEKSFGYGGLYAERYLPDARHIEVQLIGDGVDVVHLWERECSLQRRFQKVIEIAPAPALDEGLRNRLIEAALVIGHKIKLKSLMTVEFLVSDAQFYFIEANPRLQVEHTVTEAITGIDLVQTQIRIAQGATLADCGLTSDDLPQPNGYALQTAHQSRNGYPGRSF